MRKPRTLAVVTGSRADFGLLTPVLHALHAERRLRPRVIVTGTHLTTGTWRDIPRAGFPVAARVPMQRRGQTGRAADVQALARGIAGLGRTFTQLQPDVVLILGDRIEALAAATAGHLGGFHVAHIHGGDRAEGVADEAMRHAVSKLAHIHFPATTQSAQRLQRMGEDPRHIFTVGSPAVDGLDRIQPVIALPYLIVLQHPVGAAPAQEERWMRATLAATNDYPRLVLAPNSDPGCTGIQAALRRAGDHIITHLPRAQFLTLLCGALAIVGNSSAGLIEAAALRVPCVNIGPRQNGREQPNNVVSCAYGRANVVRALHRALRLDRTRLTHPYGDGHAGPRIAHRLATLNLAAIPQHKRNTY